MEIEQYYLGYMFTYIIKVQYQIQRDSRTIFKITEPEINLHTTLESFHN